MDINFKYRIVIVQLFLGFRVSSCEEGSVQTWHQGCYGTDDVINMPDATQVPAMSQFTPVICARKCLDIRKSLAAVTGTSCWCISSLPEMPLSAENCTNTCRDHSTTLPCGSERESEHLSNNDEQIDGAESVSENNATMIENDTEEVLAMSVYTSAGPYLLITSLIIEETVYIDRPAAFNISTLLAGNPHMSMRDEEEPTTSTLLMTFTFTDTTTNEIQTRHVTSSIPRDQTKLAHNREITHNFTKSSTYEIGVRVENQISVVTSNVTVRVINPPPRDIRVIVTSQQTPTCVPASNPVRQNNTTSTALYVGDAATMEASVAMGHNVTFHWWFSDVNRTVTSQCETGTNCKEAFQDHVYSQAGEHEVLVTAESAAGRVEKRVFVVAVAKEIHRLEITASKEGEVGIANDVTKFMVNIEATVPWFEVLYVNFGDGAKNFHDVTTRSDDVISENIESLVTDTITIENNHDVTTNNYDSLEEIDDITVSDNGENPASAITVSTLAPSSGDLALNEENNNMFTVDGNAYYRLANYGRVIHSDDCNTTIEIEHVYAKEGDFSLTIHGVLTENTNHNITKTKSLAVTIQHQLHVLKIKCSEIVAVNETVVCEAILLRDSRFMNVEWNIYDRTTENREQNQPIKSINTAHTNMTHLFPHPGKYKVKVTVSNQLNDLENFTDIFVFIPVSGLTLRNEKPSDRVGLNEEVKLIATVEHGTRVFFYWKPISLENIAAPTSDISVFPKNSTARYEFSQSGEFNMTVCARNGYNRVCQWVQLYVDFNPTASSRDPTTQQPITGLEVIVPKVALLGNTTQFSISVATGDHVVYDVQFGDGEPLRINHVPRAENHVQYSHVFNSTGLHEITVMAHNEVNNLSQSVRVHVQAPVPKVKVSFVIDDLEHVPVMNENVSFIVIPHVASGADSLVNLEERNDIIYQWKVNKSIVGHSTAGMRTHVFTQEGGYNISVTATNAVSRATACHVFRVTSYSNHTRFNMAAIHDVTKSVLLHVQNLPMLGAHINVTYSPGGNSTLIQSNQTTKTWAKRYSTTGLKNISLRIVPENPENEHPIYLHTSILVQAPINSLDIQGPSYLPADAPGGREYEWWARIDDATHLLYNWTLDQATFTLSPQPSFRTGLNAAGLYTLHVTAANGISSISATKHIAVIPKISSVAIVTTLVFLGNATVEIEVRGPLGYDVTLTLDDVTSLCAHTTSPIQKRIDANDHVTSTVSVTRKVQMHLCFVRKGEQTARVNVTNPVSTKQTSTQISVEEKIGRLHVSCSYYCDVIDDVTSQFVVKKGDAVEFFVTVESGENLQYRWNFGEPVEDGMLYNTAEERYTFSAVGSYEVSVQVWNQFEHEPSIAYLNILVEELISGVQVSEQNAANATILYRHQTLGSITNEITFIARVETGSSVVFEFDFGDSSETTSVDGQLVEGKVLGYATHKYTRDGRYAVRVTARNGLGSDSAAIRGGYFYVQHEVRGLAVSPSSSSVELGKARLLTASITSTTAVYYDWDMGDETLPYIDYGPEMNHTYANAGSYRVRVTARNFVSSMTFSASVSVMLRIQGVDAHVDKPSHEQGDVIRFEAHVIPLGYQPQFHWIFEGDPSFGGACPLYVQNMSCQLDKSGSFTVRVEASNDLGSVTSPKVELRTYGPIQALMIDVSGALLVGSPINFTASYYSGVGEVFEWDFGDGSPRVQTHHITVSHTYENVKEAVVQLKMSNAVLEARAEKKLFILRKPCNPPEVSITGQTRGLSSVTQVERSRDLKVEASVEINCSTIATIYSWQLYKNTSSNSSIAIELTDSSIQDPVLHLPARSLLYGNYTVMLKVSMRDTEIPVYSIANSSLRIVPSPLRAVIAGGRARDVSKPEVLLLDATPSVDPDFPGSELLYYWSCSIIYRNATNCFKVPNDQVLLNTPTLRIQGDLFDVSDISNEFLFNLTVAKSDRKNATTEQYLFMFDQQRLNVSLTCEDCDDEMVNSDSRILFETVTENYSPNQLTYRWTVKVLNEGQISEPSVSGWPLCREAARPPSTTTTTTTQITTPTTTQTTTQETTQSTTLTVKQTTTQATTQTTLLSSSMHTSSQAKKQSTTQSSTNPSSTLHSSVTLSLKHSTEPNNHPPTEDGLVGGLPDFGGEGDYDYDSGRGGVGRGAADIPPESPTTSVTTTKIPGSTTDSAVPSSSEATTTSSGSTDTTISTHKSTDGSTSNRYRSSVSSTTTNVNKMAESTIIPTIPGATTRQSNTAEITTSASEKHAPSTTDVPTIGTTIKPTFSTSSSAKSSTPSEDASTQIPPLSTTQSSDYSVRTNKHTSPTPTITVTTRVVPIGSSTETLPNTNEDRLSLNVGEGDGEGAESSRGSPGGSPGDSADGGGCSPYDSFCAGSEAEPSGDDGRGGGPLQEGGAGGRGGGSEGSLGEETGGRGGGDPSDPFGGSEGGNPDDRLDPIPGPAPTLEPTPGPDEVEDSSNVRETPPLLSRDFLERRLVAENSTTGIAKRVLGLRPGYLEQNRAYVVTVTVNHAESGLSGEATVFFRVNRSPSDGTCTLNTLTGKELETEFRLFCSGWRDQDGDYPLTYTLSYEREPGTSSRDILYTGDRREVRFPLPAGTPANNHTVLLFVQIGDSRGAQTHVCSVPVTVTPSNPVSSPNQIAQEEHTLYSLVQANSSKLHDYIQQGDNRNARLYAQIVATRLNRLPNNLVDHSDDVPSNGIPSTEQPSSDVRTDTALRKRIRHDVLLQLRDLPLRDEYEIQQTAAAVSLTTNATSELSSEALELARAILDTASAHANRLANSGRHVSDDVTGVTVQACSNLLSAVSENPNVTDRYRYSARKVVITANLVIRRSLHADLTRSVEEESPVEKDSHNVVATATRLDPSQTRNNPTFSAGNNAAKFKLPTNMDRVLGREDTIERDLDDIAHGNETTSRDCYEAHVLMYQQNPYVYSEHTKKIKSKVVALSLLNCEGRELVVQNLPPQERIQIGITHQLNKEEEEGTIHMYKLNKHQMNYHQFNTTLESVKHALHINVHIVSVREGRVFPIALLIRSKQSPTPKKYDRKFPFPLGENNIHVTLPPNTLDAEEVYFLGVVDAKFNSAKQRQGEVQERQYTLMLWWADCLYWDFDDDQWSNKGCQVSETSTFYEAQCQCNHLTSFAADFSLRPNDLSITNIEDFFDLQENPVSFSLITVILVLYVILLVLAVRMDRREKWRDQLIPLIDNNSRDVQKYILAFETGMRRNAGTTAKVSMVLYGEDGMSETRELLSAHNKDEPLFQRHARNTFLITLPESLGSLTKVQLWHNNAGSSPSWYLSRITIKDVNSGMTYYFTVNRWFAVEHDDGKVEREIPVLEHAPGFSQVFWAKGAQYLADYHVWLSTVTRPTFSRFTRAQRLSCCLCLLMSYMAVNAAWYRGEEEEYRAEFGLVDVSWRAVVVGLITSVIVLPPNALIILLFRRSKVRSAEELQHRIDAASNGGATADNSSSADSTTRLLHAPVHTTSLFDQSILNWQGLQDWAQRTWAKRYRQSPNGSTQHVQPIETMHVNDNLHKALCGTASNQVRPHKSLDSSLSSSSTQPSLTSSEAVSENDIELMLVSDKSARVFMPSCSRYLAWGICFLVTAGCATITVMYGFRFGRVKSIMWLQSLFFSLVQSAVITHPLLILLWTLYVAYKYRNDLEIFSHHDDGYTTSTHVQKTKQRKSCLKEKSDGYDLAKGIASRQRYRHLRFARPPQEKQLLEARNQTIKEKKASAVFSESTIFLATFLLLAFMAFAKDNSTAYQLNHSIASILRTGTGSDTTYDDITTSSEFWNWLQHDFVDTLFESQTSNNARVELANSIIIGHVNIRQHRVIEQKCKIPPTYQRLPSFGSSWEYCRHGFNKKTRDTQPFGHNGSWAYFRDEFTGSGKTTGRHGVYGGDGFLVMLNNNKTLAGRQVAGMREGEWIDRRTRAVVIDFTLFHAPSSLLSSVTLLIEVPSVGRMFPRMYVSSAHLYRYLTALDSFILVCELLYIVTVFFKIHTIIFGIMDQKKKYFTSVWNSLDVLYSIVAVVFMGIYLYRFVVVSHKVEELRSTYKEKFIDVSDVAFWDQIMRTLLGFLFFLVIMRSLRILRHRRPFATIGNVLKHACGDILVTMLMFMLWITAYVCLGMALFGSLSYQFHHVDSAIIATAGLMTKHYPFSHLENGSRGYVVMWQLYVTSLLIFALGSLTAYSMAVLNFHYKIYKRDTLMVLDIYDTIRHCFTQIFHWFGLQPVTFPEEDNSLPAEYTMAEVEYQVDEMLFKMNALAGTSNLPEKPPVYFTDSDTTFNGGNMDVVSGGGRINIDNVSSGGQAAILRMYQGKGGDNCMSRIERNLYEQEPHLAQLLQIRSGQGTDMLAREKHKQLRSQLELEIFRQLQMSRHSHDCHDSSNTYASSLSYQDPPSSSSSQASGSQSHSSGCHDSNPESLTTTPKMSNKLQTHDLYADVPSRQSKSDLHRLDASALSSFPFPDASNQCLEEPIPLIEINRLSDEPFEDEKYRSRKETSFHDDTTPYLDDCGKNLSRPSGHWTPGSLQHSGSSGAIEVQSLLLTKENLKKDPLLGDQPVRRKSNLQILTEPEEIPKFQSSKIFHIPYHVCDLSDSDSDSDPPKPEVKHPLGALRKTRSRGKGKGDRTELKARKARAKIEKQGRTNGAFSEKDEGML